MPVRFLQKMHHRRPTMWTVIAFIVVVVTFAVVSIWWNVLLVARTNVPVPLIILVGVGLSVVILLGLIYMFFRLLRSVQLNVAQSQFLASVTHELRSPVASLQLLLETSQDPALSPEQKREFEECMLRDLKRLSLLVDQVLDTARLENVSAAIVKETTALLPILQESAESVDSIVRARGGKLQIQPNVLNADGMQIWANRKLLLSAVQNVLENAIKYSPKEPDIRVSYRKSGNWDVIEIADNGIGIAKKDQRRIFHRFYRSNSATAQGKPGTGLGLYFAKLAVAAHSGKISVRSEGPHTGSTFKIELPALKGERRDS